MGLLVCLAQHAGEVMSKEELLATVWADVFVTEQVLKVTVSELRKALGDDARDPRFIQTIPKQGYRLIAPVTTADTQAPPLSQPQVSDAVKKNQRRAVWLTVAGLVVAMLFALTGWRRAAKNRSADLPRQINSVVVLPFRDLSGNPTEAYFAAGLTESLIADLARNTSLRVISRTSAMQYQDTRKTIPEIAGELQVDAAIEGSVLRSGERVRIIVQMIDGLSDRHLWTQQYDRQMKDLLTVQGNVAAEITRQINGQVQPDDRPDVADAVNPAAYDAWLKGRYFWHQRDRESLEKSRRYFAESVQLAPDFAPGYAGLADAQNYLALFGYAAAAEAYDNARQAALKALQLDDRLAAAHAALAFNLMYRDWNRAEAEREFRRAIALEPGRAITHHWAASLYSVLGRHDEAIAAARRAQQYDPLSPHVNGDLSWYYYYARRYDEAIRQAGRTLEMDPNASSLWLCQQLSWQFSQQPEKSFAALLAGLARNPTAATEQESYRRIYATEGLPGIWRHITQQLENDARREKPRAYRLAIGYAILGNRDRALFWLEDASRRHEGWIPFAPVDPGFDALKTDQRFQALIRRAALTFHSE